MQETYGVLLATILSFLFIILWSTWFDNSKGKLHQEENRTKVIKEYTDINSAINGDRVMIESDKLKGSIKLEGLELDHLYLSKYLSEEGDQNVILLKPDGVKNAYFTKFTWNSKGKIKLPDKRSLWNADSNILTPKKSVNFYWDNKEGVIFKANISLDENYIFLTKLYTINNSGHDIDISFGSEIERKFDTLEKGMIIMHEGFTGSIKDKLLEIKYKDIVKKSRKLFIEEQSENKKWLGFSDKYWLTSQITTSKQEGIYQLSHLLDDNKDNVFKISYKGPKNIVHSGSYQSEDFSFFAGPKELKILEDYEKSLKISLFSRSVDFGILYFITRPIFSLLQFFYHLLGNFGFAIILLTLFVRTLMLPLSIKSSSSMIKIKALQPEISRIKNIYGTNKESMNKESVALFKKHNVTPMSGCLPTLLQVPVFFALYKVLFITIEMRQAPFLFWIQDLSAPDPTNMLNLFGLFSWKPSFFLSIGVLPIILGITVYIQQRLTSAKYEDSIQAFMAKSMPYIFTVLFASFPSGLVLYWIFNNIISITQQIAVTKYIQYSSLKNAERRKK